MYEFVDRSEIIERIEHIRELHRQFKPSMERERILHERREQKVKDFLSNIRRTSLHPMLNLVRELQELCSLTPEGGHRLFGFDLDAIREYDAVLNDGRTHIVESYVFHRDLLVELPMELASAEAFRNNATLETLVRSWQRNIPIRALNRPGWHKPGTFYVHVGTEDSLGSSLPAGALALAEPIGQEEAERPNPRMIYLLQFRNGYRCSRCVVSRGKLQLLSQSRDYRGAQEFAYPSSVRIAGRIGVFAVSLPLQEHSSGRGISSYDGSAPLILPWENQTRGSLLATQHKRFVRSSREKQHVAELLQGRLHSKLSERTRRRYRSDTPSDPHVDALIHISVELYTRYSDALRTGGYPLRDRGRYSLETLLEAKQLADLPIVRAEAKTPSPPAVWEARRDEMVEWPALLSLKFPQLSLWSQRIVRVGEESGIRTVEPQIRPGSWILLEKLPAIPDISSDASRTGWARPIYALRRGLETVLGYLERDGSGFALLSHGKTEVTPLLFPECELPNLRRVCGAMVPV